MKSLINGVHMGTHAHMCVCEKRKYDGIGFSFSIFLKGVVIKFQTTVFECFSPYKTFINLNDSDSREV